MVSIVKLFRDAKPAWWHHTLIFYEALVLAVATIAEILNGAIVYLRYFGFCGILATLADVSRAPSFALAFTEALESVIRHCRLGIGLTIGCIMTEAATLAKSAVAI